MTVINSRTRGLAPMMMGNLSDEDNNHHASSAESVESEDGELYPLEIRKGKKVFTESPHDPSKGNTKGGGKGKTDRECFRCGRIGHIRAECRARTHTKGRPKSAPKGKGVGNCEDEEKRPHTKRWSFEVLSDHGDEVDVDEPTDETTEMMPPLPPDSWFKKTEMLCGKFRKPCNGGHRDQERVWHYKQARSHGCSQKNHSVAINCKSAWHVGLQFRRKKLPVIHSANMLPFLFLFASVHATTLACSARAPTALRIGHRGS